MCLLRLKHLPTKLISQRLCTPKNQPGSQVRLVGIATNSGLSDKNIGAKKLAHEYEPVLNQQQNCGYDTIQLPPPPTYSSQNEGIWIAALAFILGINVGGAYIVYKSKIKKTITFDDSKKSGQSKKPKVPLTSSEIPNQVPYLIIGGGTASFSAFRAIQEKDPKAKILVLSKELDTPYMRPPLSKELWIDNGVHTGKKTDVQPITFKQWNGLDRDLHYEPNEFYIHPSKLLDEPNGGVAIVQGYTVQKVDVENRTAILTDGTKIQYGSCLIATGSSPRNLPIFENAPTEVKKRISLFKTIDDYSNLKKYVDQSKSIAIVGGGFLGSELACGLAKYGEDKKLQVHQVFHEPGNMGKILPEFLSKWTTARVRDLGVNVIPNTEIQSVALVDNNNRIKLTFCNGQSVICDHIVVAVGSSPNINLAKESGLEVDKDHGGFLVNAELEARNHLFVAGDAASFYDPILGRRRVEHHDHAVVSGRLAGENMLGTNKPYTHQSMFWSDLGPQVSYEGLGKIDSKLPTVSVFVKKQPSESPSNSKSSVLPSVHAAEMDDNKDDFSKGVVFYMQNEKIVGIVLWNVFDRINIARHVLSQDKQYGPNEINEVAKLFDIHA